MEWFDKIVSRITGFGISIGIAFLLGAMLVMVANIAYRFFGGTIPGTYELVGPFVSVTGASALAFTALKQAHVVMDIVLHLLPDRIQKILKHFSSFICLCFCLILVWSSITLMLQKFRLGEETTLLKIPIFPFRGFWVLGLLFFCLVFFADLLKAFSNKGDK